MPSVYASERLNVCSFPKCRRPTMMLERMGIMGNTQGVSASSRPKPKKPLTISHSLPFFNRSAAGSLPVDNNAEAEPEVVVEVIDPSGIATTRVFFIRSEEGVVGRGGVST